MMNTAQLTSEYDVIPKFLNKSRTEPGGWISLGKIDYNLRQTVRNTEESYVKDHITPVLRMIGIMWGTRSDQTADE